MSKIRDNDYLCLSAMLRGKEAHMIGAEAFQRMADAENASAAAKMAEDYGYTDLDLSTPQTVDASFGRILNTIICIIYHAKNDISNSVSEILPASGF